jgi:hypothetical protein
MLPGRRALLLVIAGVVGVGCGKIGSRSDGAADAGPAAASAAGSTAAQAPCVAGKWDAKDQSSRIKSAVKSAANAGLTPAGGKITYDFSAPSADGKGIVTVTVADFVNKMALAQGGVQISGTITLSGTAKMPYTLGPEDALTIAVPTEGKINAHADVRTSGIVNTHNTEDSAVDLHGAFVYECAGDKMEMWNRSSAGKHGAPLVFSRIK